MQKGLRIAIGHKARVGKDTFADYIDQKYGCRRLNFAEGVYEVCTAIQKILNIEVKKDPELLQFEGMGLRKIYGDLVWINRVRPIIEQIDKESPEVNIIITDMRLENEFDFLKENGFTTININRKNRIIDRDPNHISEIALDNAVYDFKIDNDGTIDDFYISIDSIIKQI